MWCSSPVPELSWSRVSGTLPSGRHYTSQSDTQLTIHNVTLSDSGDYECHGRNSKSTAHYRFRLVVGGHYQFFYAFPAYHFCELFLKMAKSDSVLFD